MNPSNGTQERVAAKVADAASLRLPQDFAASAGVEKVLVRVPVTKPPKQWFVRTRPGPDFRGPFAILELKEEGEVFVVTPLVAAHLPHDVRNVVLVAAINRNNDVFLWPLRIPNTNGNDAWANSAIAASKIAETDWVRVTANMGAGAYDVAKAIDTLPEPVWPKETFDELFKLGFGDKVIDSLHHPVIRKLQGGA